MLHKILKTGTTDDKCKFFLNTFARHVTKIVFLHQTRHADYYHGYYNHRDRHVGYHNWFKKSY